VKLFFDDVGFDGQLQCSVGKCDAGMANVGETLYIASQIEPGDRDRWYAAWSETDVVSIGQGRQLFDALTCPKSFRRFLRNDGAEGHCEGMAQSCSGLPRSTGSKERV